MYFSISEWESSQIKTKYPVRQSIPRLVKKIELKEESAVPAIIAIAEFRAAQIETPPAKEGRVNLKIQNRSIEDL